MVTWFNLSNVYTLHKLYTFNKFLHKRKESKEMKMLVSFAMFVATLLLVTAMAFALGCDQTVCYNTTITHSGCGTSDATLIACLNNDATGSFKNVDDPGDPVPLVLFGGSPFGANFDLVPGWSTWIIDDTDIAIIIRGFFWTSGDGIYLIGQGTTGTAGGERWILKGTRVLCPPI